MSRNTMQANLNIDQQRARHAWEVVERLSVDSDKAGDYAGEAKKLPARIVTSGLGQALAFIAAKKAKKEGLVQLEKDLTEWAQYRLEEARSHPTLLEAVLKTNSDFLRRATDEMLAYLNWLIRFLDAKGC